MADLAYDRQPRAQTKSLKSDAEQSKTVGNTAVTTAIKLAR